MTSFYTSCMRVVTWSFILISGKSLFVIEFSSSFASSSSSIHSFVEFKSKNNSYDATIFAIISSPCSCLNSCNKWDKQLAEKVFKYAARIFPRSFFKIPSAPIDDASYWTVNVVISLTEVNLLAFTAASIHLSYHSFSNFVGV
uniref:Secreted protein n=1 Tax=Strongyloides venezuelensis TaxID=75913 RepID=A0A0K0FDH9_STRVS